MRENKNYGNRSELNNTEDEEMSAIQEFIEAQRPENTTKKTSMTLTSGKDFVLPSAKYES